MALVVHGQALPRMLSSPSCAIASAPGIAIVTIHRRCMGVATGTACASGADAVAANNARVYAAPGCGKATLHHLRPRGEVPAI